jgi:hypothetical protein
MEFKGTKGKWEIDKNDVRVNEEIIITAYGFNVKGKYTHTEETKANALLISKAPEMLEMLKELRNAILSEDYVRMLANSQLAKELIKEATEL